AADPRGVRPARERGRRARGPGHRLPRRVRVRAVSQGAGPRRAPRAGTVPLPPAVAGGPARRAGPARHRRGDPCLPLFPGTMACAACQARRGAVQCTAMIPRLLLLSLVLLLAACAQAPVRNPLAQWRPSPNHDERRAVAIVIHATEQRSVAESLLTLSAGNSGGPVSAHYLVGEDGTIYQLVEESRRAWHAGGGRWGTITDLNSASIGIELDNDGAEPFPPAQIEALLRLLEDLCTRLGIPRHAVIAHADLAPTRKRDPGIHFPWRRLAEA